MRHRASTRHNYIPEGDEQAPVKAMSAAQIAKRLWPYLWQYKGRVAIALALVLVAKGANVGVPLLLKQLVDALSPKPDLQAALLAVPLGLLLAYGLLRYSASLFAELREVIFARVTQGIARTLTTQTYAHLHKLSLRFHLARQTGGMTRDIERGTRALQSMISLSVYNILPTLVELSLVVGILAYKFGAGFALIALTALVCYIAFTFVMTEWRTVFRKKMNELDSQAHSHAVDALINYETVKYFNNEQFETERYDRHLAQFEKAAVQTQVSLAALNNGQQLIIATALVAMLYLATQGVVSGALTLGDLVMINAFMIQIYLPLNFLGVVYREIRQSLIDVDKMFRLQGQQEEIADAPGAQALLCTTPPEVRFHDVHFAYEPDRLILRGLSFTIPAGKTVAVVGSSGAGKSTLARLLYRFYDVQQGAITVNGHDLKRLTQDSLRRAIGIVPQDTVLFNDSIGYNIAYGRPGCSQAEIEAAAKAAHIHQFVASTPKGYETRVGERGLKLSGGEKQRVSIARTLLKNPPILIFDEATSALDSANERAIQAELESVAEGKTTLIIAHRLSTIVRAHHILVLEQGQLAESGTHDELLAQQGLYARMWALQHTEAAEPQEQSL